MFGESSSRRTHQSHNHYYVDDSLFEHPNGGGHPNLAAQKSHPGRERERLDLWVDRGFNPPPKKRKRY